MANLFVSYDLHAPGQNYDHVIDAIKRLGNWAKVHYSLFYVKSNHNASQATELVWAAMDGNDKVLVVDASNGNAAWKNLDNEVSQFIRTQWSK